MRAQFLFAGAKHKNTSVGEQVEGNLMLPGDWEVNDRRSRQLDELCSVDSALGSNANRFLSFAAEISATGAKVNARRSIRHRHNGRGPFLQTPVHHHTPRLVLIRSRRETKLRS